MTELVEESHSKTRKVMLLRSKTCACVVLPSGPASFHFPLLTFTNFSLALSFHDPPRALKLRLLLA